MSIEHQSESKKEGLGLQDRIVARRLSVPISGLTAIALVPWLLLESEQQNAAALSDLVATPSAAAASLSAASPALQLPSFADLVARVKPAVVSVYVNTEEKGRIELFGEGERGGNNFSPGFPFQFFFRQFGEPGLQAQPHIIQAQGSGFFISADGYILTNNHVIDHAQSVKIKMIDGTTYPAKVVGADSKTDLAVLKVSASHFSFVTFASTQPLVGDWVLAMGYPYGLGGTVTAGIISASGRDIGSGSYDDYLQIDAPVNKGNSGGPTFNLSGEVVGVNTAIYSPSGGSIGIAFDIPADTAMSVARQLETKGTVTRGWIGVTVQPITQDIAESLGLKDAKGALVDDIQNNC